MSLDISMIKGNIAEVDCECIVNSAKPTLKEGAGVCGAIFSKAGRWKLSRACAKLKGCQVGESKITKGFKLKAKWIIHTVAPWNTGLSTDESELAKCYTSSLLLAKQYNIREICFPLIGAGVRHFSDEEAYRILYDSVNAWHKMNSNYKIKVIVCLDDKTYEKLSLTGLLEV